ncbi:MAG: hypothetical protein DRP02_05570 [Candidatus Gerdarchaeota archaeon]|nr:MAG: hypothetical protein DRP02_05570 [Candidatus Gerdarchaeota archaeon]
MTILPYELNLSKTEFFYYLECPRKFRLHRLLNPVPSKSTFMSTTRATTNYFLRHYEKQSLRGILYHSFFENFHKQYWNRITEPKPPEELMEDQIKCLFWQYQQKKYFTSPDYWIPYRTEVRLMTEHQRGVIDCVELCDDKYGLRIIDYKARPSTQDLQELLFYANLMNVFRENKEEEWIEYDVVEVGCYYYLSGEERVYEIKQKDLLAFTNLLQRIIEEISRESFPGEKTPCKDCRLNELCKLIP